jgi:hypothetical protein
MQDFKVKCAILIGSLAMFMADGLRAETWVCEVKADKQHHLIPEKVTFKFDEYLQRVQVSDSYAQKFGRSVSVGEVEVDNQKRRSISWKISGLPRQNKKSHYEAFTELSFRANVMKKTGQVILLARPTLSANLDNNQQVNKGLCLFEK